MLAITVKALYAVGVPPRWGRFGDDMPEELKIQLRVPKDVRDWFKAYSDGHNRSMNGQFIAMVREMMRQAHAKQAA